MRERQLYDDPVVYDVLHTPGTAREVDALQKVAGRYRGAPPPPRRWLEPACGTGRYLRVLARRGERAVGFDANPRMVADARRRLAPLSRRGLARVLQADMRSFVESLEGERFDVAFTLINSIRHLPSDAALDEHLASMAEALRPGGVYLVGLHLSDYGRESASMDRWFGRRGALAVEQKVGYAPPRTEEEIAAREEWVSSRIVVQRPSGTERWRSRYPLRCYDAVQWGQALARSPLALDDALDDSGRRVVPVPGRYAVFVLRRPSSLRPSAARRR
jgi:SAM-dependent methyltransferase